MKYTVQVWYRSRDQKDFEIYEVEATDESQAKRKALDQHKKGIPFKTEIL